jgi:hypothetical protein
MQPTWTLDGGVSPATKGYPRLTHAGMRKSAPWHGSHGRGWHCDLAGRELLVPEILFSVLERSRLDA